MAEHVAAERASMKPLPAGRFDAVLCTVRRVSHGIMISAGGNLYSVPDDTVEGVLEVETTADCVRTTTTTVIAWWRCTQCCRDIDRLGAQTRPRGREAWPLQPPGHGVARKGLDVCAAIVERASTPNRCGLRRFPGDCLPQNATARPKPGCADSTSADQGFPPVGNGHAA